jgi:hypothetical protein
VPTLSRGISLNSVPCFRNTLPVTQDKAKANQKITQQKQGKAKQIKAHHE